jgi:hypothetical protein
LKSLSFTLTLLLIAAGPASNTLSPAKAKQLLDRGYAQVGPAFIPATQEEIDSLVDNGMISLKYDASCACGRPEILTPGKTLFSRVEQNLSMTPGHFGFITSAPARFHVEVTGIRDDPQSFGTIVDYTVVVDGLQTKIKEIFKNYPHNPNSARMVREYGVWRVEWGKD